MMTTPTRPSRPLRGIDALLDALRYPLQTAALVTNVVYIIGRVIASMLPVLGPLLHAVLTLGIYKYAFECLATSAQGRAQPPDVVGNLQDIGTHRRHLLLQLLWLLLLVVATQVVGRDIGLLMIAAVALALPGALLALTAAQNLTAALNPLSWWTVATRLGPTYLLLALATFAVLMLQASARDLLEHAQPRLLAVVAFHALSQHLVIALFRGLGNALHANATALQYDISDADILPPIERDRERAAQSRERSEALAQPDPAERVKAIAVRLRDGADHDLHREYRRALRELGRHDALLAHARTHVCELLVLGQKRAALALASEALEDNADFTLPEAASVQSLLDAGERAGLLRQIAAIASNYTEAFPKRYDGLPLALRAASLYADRLNDPSRARTLLEKGAALAADGAEAGEFLRLRQRLEAGMPLREAAFVDPRSRPA